MRQQVGERRQGSRPAGGTDLPPGRLSLKIWIPTIRASLRGPVSAQMSLVCKYFQRRVGSARAPSSIGGPIPAPHMEPNL